jgi:hypothetical protein
LYMYIYTTAANYLKNTKLDLITAVKMEGKHNG